MINFKIPNWLTKLTDKIPLIGGVNIDDIGDDIIYYSKKSSLILFFILVALALPIIFIFVSLKYFFKMIIDVVIMLLATLYCYILFFKFRYIKIEEE